MGTNYYIEEQPACQHCGHGAELKHIGKSLHGWCFGLHVYPEDGINNLNDWECYWSDKQIVNECGEKLTPEEMLDVITNRSFGGTWTDLQLEQNEATRGPNGLARHTFHCVGHGIGTWDLIVGEFS